MSLYDDVDTKQVSEWSSGINKLMPQPALNKIQQTKKPNVRKFIKQNFQLK